MTSTATAPVRWCRSSCDSCNGSAERGSADRYQMRLFALRVTVAVMGAAICHCGTPVSLFSGEVDRTASGCYRPGYVFMACEPCNNDRTYCQTFDTAAYEAATLRASLTVTVPTKAEAKRVWQAGPARGESLSRSVFNR